MGRMEVNHLEINEIYNIDCMEALPMLADKSVDMILSDLPYCILECKWDKKISLPEYFRECNRVIKDNGAIVLTATMRFANELINANSKFFRYDLIWEKTSSVGHANCNRMPMRNHELILVFYKHLPTYNPQGLTEVTANEVWKKRVSRKENVYRPNTLNKPYVQKYTGYPVSIIKFSNKNNFSVHPTQKPLDLFRYLVLTYTNPGDLVLDTCIGSGTTAVACVETGRRFIGFEKEEKYCVIARERISGVQSIVI